MTTRKKIGVTIGDPAGIGPEIVLKAIQDPEIGAVANLVVIGSRAVLEEHALTMGKSVDDIIGDNIELEDIPFSSERLNFGEISANCGAASFAYLARSIELAKAAKISGIATAPVHKEAWKAAKIPHIGHTEALATLLASKAETLFVVGNLRIFFLTRHLSLRDAIEAIETESLIGLLHHAKRSLLSFGIKDPRIAVAGLNPHAGDGGLFGDEEIKILAPAVKDAQSQEINAFGPLPADSVFHQCANGEFDAVIALFHDQGHIAAKMYNFHGTVSVTTGLPIPRTSVDHGTAFDIAGKNKADPTSMIEAIKLAVKLVSS